MSETPENQQLSAFEKHERLDALEGAFDAIGDEHEVRAIELLLSKGEEPITWEAVSLYVLADRSPEDQDILYTLNDTLGFPNEEDKVEIALLSPHDVQDNLMQEHPGTRSYFNNEFALFQIDPNFRPGDPLPDPMNFMEVGYTTRPVRMRFRELFPNLYSALYERAHGKGLRDFYDDLAEGTKESEVNLTLFTMADQLMQRLIRSGDDKYQLEYAITPELELGHPVALPSYEDVVHPEAKVAQVDARQHLFT